MRSFPPRSSRSRPAPAPREIIPHNPSLRLLGIVLAIQPWLAWPGLGVSDPFGLPRWLAGTLGLTAVLILLLRELHPTSPSPQSEIHIPHSAFRIPHSFLPLAALLIVAGLLLSSLASPVPLLGLRVTLREGLFVLFALTVALTSRPTASDLRWILHAFLLSVSFQAVLALLQFAAPDLLRPLAPAFVVQGPGRRALSGTFGNPEYLAGWLAAGLVAAAIATLHPPDARPRWDRLLPPVAALLALTVIFMSGGRGAFLSAIGALAVWFIWVARARMTDPTRNGLRRPRWRFLIVGALSALILLTAIAALSPPLRTIALPARLLGLTHLQSTSLRHRVGLSIVTSHMIRDRPLLGCGPGRFGAGFSETLEGLVAVEPGIAYWSLADLLSVSYVGEAHCDPLQWWAEYGLLPILGLSLLLALALAGPLPLLRGSPGLPAAEALWTALLALAFNMWVSFPLHEPARAILWWSLLGLLISLSRSKSSSLS